MILFPLLIHWPDLPKLPEVPYMRITTAMLYDRKRHIARIMLERIGRSEPLRVDHEDVPCLVQGVDYIWEDRTYVVALFNGHFFMPTAEQMEDSICHDEPALRKAMNFTAMIPFVEAWANDNIEEVREMWSAAI